MQVPVTFYMVIRKYKDGHEDTDGMEFSNRERATEYMLHLKQILPSEELETLDSLYVDSATWLYEA